MAGMTRAERREKADRTTGVATEIIRKEQAASAAKTARLRAEREQMLAAKSVNGVKKGAEAERR